MASKKISVSVTYTVPAQGINTTRITNAIQRTLQGEKVKQADIAVIIVSDDELLELNKMYLNHHYYTDVITFPLGDEGGPIEGEIYISMDTAAAQAKEYSVSRTNELTRLAVHGTLHLVGYDDATKEQRQHMHVLENKYI
ncbi:MAG: rRNA maturation RNase YbeY [Candidatus Kapabacteria bacterium]|nr:rRNA maturation RNase YbeY [Candidatus Kapabacteria bacterium]